MKKVITYGTFDMLHKGHINLLRRAKELGDYLMVGVTSDNYDRERGKLNVHDTLLKRVEAVRNTGFVDEIIVEEYVGQKINDIQKYGIDIFAIGSDWTGKFDYLKEYCEVVYLPRTKGISSTQLRNEIQNICNIGIVGCGRIANRFVPESKFVSGVNVPGVFNPHINSATAFAERHALEFATDSYDELLSRVDAVYIASPHLSHYDYAKRALSNGKHVLCEKPITIDPSHSKDLYTTAKSNGLVMLEAIKTAYCPGFTHLISLVKSGVIGTIKDVDATFTKLVSGNNLRELSPEAGGGSMTELASYVLLPALKIMGAEYTDCYFHPICDNGVDIFTRGLLKYPHGTASFKVGLGVKSEGQLIISGTKGYAYVPAPWWKTDYFEIRYENTTDNRKYFYRFEGEGLRYELEHFVSMIEAHQTESYLLPPDESIALTKIIHDFREEIDKR